MALVEAQAAFEESDFIGLERVFVEPSCIRSCWQQEDGDIRLWAFG
jgi:hypothetical protein